MKKEQGSKRKNKKNKHRGRDKKTNKTSLSTTNVSLKVHAKFYTASFSHPLVTSLETTSHAEVFSNNLVVFPKVYTRNVITVN